ncbi:hypothetical protein [Phyllobacterium calauticae]|jgi:hypothetical protein|uniref:hypothetical protein n=1 Tax=Phyllobacterium calauticae TaxID=2817027 RepID=UPI001CC17743|nr:hypothetical protein [Phyllobacterium calauticae]MBZ3693403.1 hypothetical protein [Phyllobacterium calauticae]
MSNQIEFNAASRRQGSIGASPISSVDPSSGTGSPVTDQLSTLIDNHQASLAEVDIAIEQDPSEGSEGLQLAFEKEQIALEQLLQYSPRNLGEVNFKSSYFLERSDFLGCEDPHMLMFLRAMVQVA